MTFYSMLTNNDTASLFVRHCLQKRAIICFPMKDFDHLNDGGI